MTPRKTDIPTQSPAPSAQPGTRSTAGFPSPADDYVESPLDLNRLLVKRPAATFFMRAGGNALRAAGITHGDLLIVDRARKVTPGAIVVALIDGELQLQRSQAPAAPDSEPHTADDNLQCEIWGVVTCVIRELNH